MLRAIFDWLRIKLGHWLLEKEDADKEARQREIERRRKEIIDANYSTEDTANDLDRGDF